MNSEEGLWILYPAGDNGIDVTISSHPFDNEGRKGQVWVGGITGEILFIVHENDHLLMRFRPRSALVHRDHRLHGILMQGPLANAGELLTKASQWLIDALAEASLKYGPDILLSDLSRYIKADNYDELFNKVLLWHRGILAEARSSPQIGPA
jgi:hypothetical protein